MKIRNVTNWEKPSLKFDSEYGIVNYKEWCDLEVKRMNKVNEYFRYYVRTDSENKIAIIKQGRKKCLT